MLVYMLTFLEAVPAWQHCVHWIDWPHPAKIMCECLSEVQ